jgi:hypothetical protein
VFEGQKVLFSHKDPATSAHADLNEVLGVSLAGLSEDCGCPPDASTVQQAKSSAPARSK